MPVNQEWLNENSLRNYPLKENVQRIPYDNSGNLISGVQIPNYLLVDFIVTLPGSINIRIYLSQLSLVSNLLSLIFSDESAVQLARIEVDLNSHLSYTAYNFEGSGTYDDVRGCVALGNLDNLHDDLPEGIYNFTIAQSETEATTVRPMLRGIRSVRTVNNNDVSEFIYGHVKLLAGTNVRLTFLPEYNTIRIDAIEGEGLTDECTCKEEIGATNIVRTINGIPVQDAQIIGDGECVTVETSGNQVIISDTCSAPCCGCPELEFITDSLKVLDSTISNLESYSQQLAERISNFVTNFILTIGA